MSAYMIRVHMRGGRRRAGRSWPKHLAALFVVLLATLLAVTLGREETAPRATIGCAVDSIRLVANGC